MLEEEIKIRQMTIELVTNILNVEQKSFDFGCAIGHGDLESKDELRSEMLDAELAAERTANKLRDFAIESLERRLA